MVENSNTSYENEIHRVDSPSNKIYGDKQNIYGKWQKAGKFIVMQIREWSILRGNIDLCSLVPESLFSYMLDQIIF